MKLCLIWFSLFAQLWFSGCSAVIEIDLSSFNPLNQQLFNATYIINEVNTELYLTNIGDDVGFIVVQVHSYIHNLTLSYGNNSVQGTNIGLVYADDNSTTTFLLKQNNGDANITVLIAVTVYDVTDPVPGGCNLSFGTEVAPYQIVSYDDDTISVKSQPPSAYGTSCDNNRIQVDMYHLFLNQFDYSQETYFKEINKFLSVESIVRHGLKVPYLNGYHKYNRIYSSYRGTGEVFAIVATFKNCSAAYVPTLSYGCDIGNWKQSCVEPVTSHWRFICALLLIFGFFTCLLGHKYFRTSLFLMAFVTGVLLTHILLSFISDFSSTEISLFSIAISTAYGALWIFLWWKYGIPLMSVNLSLVLSGFLLASMIFHAGLADLQVFHSNINFWMAVMCIILTNLILWTAFTMRGHIFACSFLGSYAFISALCYYIGGHFPYIFINAYRRTTVKHFNIAVIDPPFERIDIFQAIFWQILLLFGIWYQLKEQEGKPPFPPNRSARSIISEATPLIQEHQPEYV